MSAMLDRARLLWSTLASATVAFPPRGVAVVVAPESRLCPPGWCGVVTRGDSAIATVPLLASVPPEDAGESGLDDISFDLGSRD